MQRRLIEGLHAFTVTLQVAIYTDSEHVQKGITEWICGWKIGAKQSLKNVDKCL